MYRPTFGKRLLSYFWPITIERVKGHSEHLLEVIVYHGKVMLDTEKVNYSFGSLHKVMHGVLSKLKNKKYPMNKVLILGYGGGSAAKIIHEEINPEAQIVGVDIDKTVLEIASKYFYTSGVKLVASGAEEYLESAKNNEWGYDTLVIDLFIDDKIPEFSDRFWELVRNLLTSDGVALINTMLDEPDFKKLGEEIKSFGFQIQPWNEIRENRVWVFKK